MKTNIDGKGRLIRAAMSLALLVAAVAAFCLGWPVGIGVAFFLAGLFVAFEATRGWCIARACGIKTRF